MKKSLSVVALLLAVVMIAVCCVACGEKASIVGKWTTEIDFDKYMGAALDSSEGDQMSEMIANSLKGVKVVLNITFNEDKTCVLQGEKNSVEAASEKIKSSLTESLKAMGLGEEQVAQLASTFDISSIADGQTKKYELDGSKLYLFDDEDPKDENKYLEIELSSSELKVVKVVGNSEEVPESLLPLVLTKAD